MKKDSNYMLVLNAISYVGVIVINVLAQLGMLNNLSTQEISDQYVSLFTPSAFTFAIWGVIYILLGVYVVYQFVTKDKKTVMQIAPLFFFTNIANIMWIISWHYSTTIMSLIVILILLFFLMLIVKDLKENNVLVKTTFSIYYAWITVASIASFFVYIVSIIEPKFDPVWMILLVNIALGIVGLLIVIGGRNKNLPYILTLLWSVVGIIVKHLSSSGFNGKYLSIVFVGIIVLLFGALEIINIIFMNNKKEKVEDGVL